jgi:hypothetical protein
LSCGHVWTRLQPDELRAFIGLSGTELGKQHFETILHGPYHDLPNVPAAHGAADKVAELDALVASGKDAEATRRYRDLSGMTWDQAIAGIWGWRYQERAKKLALFGWPPKEKTPTDEAEAEGHPMRDRWLDG